MDKDKLVERTLADEVRAIAEDSNYSNELVGIAVRNWFHRQAAARSHAASETPLVGKEEET